MNTIKKVSLGLVFFLSMTCIVNAQRHYQKGNIQITKRKSIEAYISIDFNFPQRFQNAITYITPKDFAKYLEKGKIKNKKKVKLKLKEFEGFTLENGKKFQVVKYADLTKKKLGMLPKRICLEQIAEGKINAFKMYSRTTGKISAELANIFMDSRTKGEQMLIDYIQDNFQILVQKNTKNPRNIMQINLLNYIGDNERVKTNYDANHYGFRNQFTERQKFGVIVNKEYEAAFLRMVNDYNNGTLEEPAGK
ncbi:hypothetical protein [Ascidiimonas sp. W6]|uniref:hypothetical protein n=1 Tax=Ascidiimonas meishanensis TaxID=3128903 RepID=UPI0030EC9732